MCVGPMMSHEIRNLIWLILLTGGVVCGQTVPNIRETAYCPNYPSGKPPLTPPATTAGELRKVVLNAPGAVCNDGSPAIMYVRAARAGATELDGPSANRWVIHFEGGSGCDTFEDCGVRWCGIGFYTAEKMSTLPARDAAGPGGLMSRNAINRFGDRNLVMLNYCSSDGWKGRRANVELRSSTEPNKAYTVHYQGATIASAAFDALERGVAGLPRLADATDVLISGDSAGANAVGAHLDRLAARLKAVNPNVRVRGMLEAAFGLDLNGRQGFPAGDPRDSVFAFKSGAFQKAVALQNPQLDDSCVAAHPGAAAYLCDDPGYVELNHITTPFFQIQDLSDSNQLEAMQRASDLNPTPAQFSQKLHDQLNELVNIRNTAVEKSAISVAPGVVGRNCGIHVTWGDDDGFLGKRIRSDLGSPAYSFYELLWNWMNGILPANIIAPKPPSTPENPLTDPICNAKAPAAPAGPVIATASNASYNFGEAVAANSIVATFGTGLSISTAVASTIPWPVSLGGTQVVVTDASSTARSAPIYYASPTQLIYLIPAGTVSGTAQVAIGTQRMSVEVADSAPGIYTANQSGKGVAAATYLRITSAGVRSEGYLFDPVTKLDTGVPAAAGDQVYLILYGTGMRGAAATATVGGVNVPVAGPVAQGQYPGLDQMNLGPLPTRIGLGQKEIVVRQGTRLANGVSVTFRVP